MKRIAILFGLLCLFTVATDSLGAQNSTIYLRDSYAHAVAVSNSALVVRFFVYHADEDAVVRLYRVPIGVRLDWMRHHPYSFERADLRNLELVASKVAESSQSDGYVAEKADFGAQRNGEYLAVFRDGRGSYDARLYEVGNLGTVWHAVGATLLVYAVDLKTFKRRSDVQYSVWQGEGGRQALVTFGGLSISHVGGFQNAILYGRAADGSETVQRIYENQISQDIGYIQTDRPVYRTGQHVYARAVLRDGSIGAYVVPHGSVSITVRSYDGTTLYQDKAKLSRFGTVAFDFAIPQSAHLGEYQIFVGKVSTTFDVQEYKKPEYALVAQPTRRVVVGGDPVRFAIDAKYFFGRPAAGMHIHYYGNSRYFYGARYNPYEFMGSGYRYGDDVADASGDTVTDEAGHLSVIVPTTHVSYEQNFNLQVDGRDASGRTVSSAASALIVPASLRIDVSPDRWFAQVGDDVNLSVATRDYEAHMRPNIAVQVEIAGSRWNYYDGHETQLPVIKYSVYTDAHGRANLQWRPQRAASYEITLSAKDERGNKTQSSLYYWVSSPNEAWWYPNQRINLIADKETYRPGERPKILLTAPATNADALLVVVSDRIASARVVHIGNKPQTITVDSPKDATFYTVHVEVPGKDGLKVGDTQISVSPAPRILNVTLRPNKKKYAPGERAVFAVHVRNLKGQPVRAEVGLGIVDEALYAVQADSSTPVLQKFYDHTAYVQFAPSWNRVDNEAVSPAPAPTPDRVLREIGSVASRPSGELVKAGTTSDVYSVAAGAATVRNYFPDTAFWKPDVQTDADGNATVRLRWPDNLTTWRASGVAVDMETNVGSGWDDALVSKDFLVRLETPRFLRRGDHSQFTGIVNGRAGSRRAFLSLDAGDLSTMPAHQSVMIDSNATGNAIWSIDPLTSLGNRDVTLRGSDGSLADAMRLTVPIEAAGAAEHLRDAAEVHDRDTVALALPKMYDPGALHITMSPSVIASLLQNVKLLDVYPYYCVEQTMSAALPDVFIDRLAKQTGATLPSDSPAAPAVVQRAVLRLHELQHSDGSWGWWEHDNAHPFMTAYALYGLTEFRKSGYAVPQQMYEAGITSLLAQLQTSNDDTLRLWGGRQPGSQWNTRAFMLFSLANAAPERMNRALLARTMEHLGNLNDYALAVLGLAQHQLGDDGAARLLLARLNSHMVQTNAYGYWLSQTWHYAWQDDPIEATAYALRLNNALEPQSPRIAKIVNFLRSQQRGGWWYTTKDTAAAVYAIAEAEHTRIGELHPDETVDVFIGQKRVRHLQISTPLLAQKDAIVDVPAQDLQGGAQVRFVVSGSGALYWSTDWTRYAPPYARKVADVEQSILSRLRAQPSSFSIERSYLAPHTPWQVGDEITVETTIRSASDTDYVAIEDPFPAGVEYQPLQGEGGASDWNGLQFFDDRVVFFADHLWSNYPLRVRYTLRVTTPGSYTAAPPIAYAMYGPPVSTVGQPDRVTIR